MSRRDSGRKPRAESATLLPHAPFSAPHLVASTDGAARGNPGPAAIGVLIVDEAGATISEISARIGERTNNQAEYEALLAALRELSRLQPAAAVVRTDSELLYFQMTGAYRVRNHELALLKAQACRLLADLRGIRFELVPREHNREADRLANQAFRQARGTVIGTQGLRPKARRAPAVTRPPSLFDEQ